jgi:predicted RecB family nuclease
MVASLENLWEVVDQTRIDRKLADKIEAERERIDRDIEATGHSDVTVDGQTFRITKKETAKAKKETAA